MLSSCSHRELVQPGVLGRGIGPLESSMEEVGRELGLEDDTTLTDGRVWMAGPTGVIKGIS